MRFRPRRYRSAGIVVSAAVHRLIAAGDRARAGERWPEAAISYAQAVAAQPSLTHIRIQLGHSLKESGRLAEAEQVYREALTLRPADREATLHLAHMLKLNGALTEAAGNYVSLALADPDDEEAMREARDLIGKLDDDRRRTLAAALVGGISAERIDTPSDGHPAISECTIVYDASDLIAYFSHARRPTGIQRVQLETLVQALRQNRQGGERVGVCCFIDGRDEWVAIPPVTFLDLAALSVADDGDDPSQWRRMRDRLHLRLLVADAFEFARGAALVNLGTSWWLQNYFLHVRDAQARRGIVYIPMIYDMIPILFPDWCIDGLVQDFIAWAEGVFAHTAHFLAISESSKRDLIATADGACAAIRPDDVVVVPLHADFVGASGAGRGADLSRIIDDEPFILFVATIEPRKGHLVAFDAWSRLIDQLGPAEVPRLVCVGRNGWRNDAVFSRLAADPALRQRVTILADLSDATLATLYARSLFTIYPSLYEGWGLPVTEALCRGKVVVTTTSSSLPEAGGAFANFVPPGDPVALADEVQRLVCDPSARRAREEAIVSDFLPKGWDGIARQIGDAVVMLTRQAATDGRGGQRGLPPVARPGAWYWLGRSYAMALRPMAASGEAFRAGLNWQAPEEWGCRIKRSDAVLAMRVSPAAALPGERLSVTLRLVGSNRGRCAYRIDGGAERIEGVLGRRERLAVSLVVEVLTNSMVSIALSGRTDGVGISPDAEMPFSMSDNLGIECFTLERSLTGKRSVAGALRHQIDDVALRSECSSLVIGDLTGGRLRT